MVDPHLRRIAFVTRAYPRMRAAILGLGFGLPAIWLLRCMRQEDLSRAALAFIALFATLLLLRIPERWLDRRFGRVLPVRANTNAIWSWRQQLSILAGVSLWRADQWSMRAGGPPIIVLGLAALGLWIFLRDWRHRPYTAIFPLVCLLAAVALSAASGRADVLEWRMRADAAAVTAWMTVGVFDLLMLWRVLGVPRTAAAENGIDADTL